LCRAAGCGGYLETVRVPPGDDGAALLWYAAACQTCGREVAAPVAGCWAGRDATPTPPVSGAAAPTCSSTANRGSDKPMPFYTVRARGQFAPLSARITSMTRSATPGPDAELMFVRWPVVQRRARAEGSSATGRPRALWAWSGKRRGPV